MLLNCKVSCFVHKLSQPNLLCLALFDRRKNENGKGGNKPEEKRIGETQMSVIVRHSVLFYNCHMRGVFRKSHGSICLRAKNTEGCDITIPFFCQQPILSGSSNHWEDNANALSLFAER